MYHKIDLFVVHIVNIRNSKTLVLINFSCLTSVFLPLLLQPWHCFLLLIISEFCYLPYTVFIVFTFSRIFSCSPWEPHRHKVTTFKRMLFFLNMNSERSCIILNTFPVFPSLTFLVEGRFDRIMQSE